MGLPLQRSSLWHCQWQGVREAGHTRVGLSFSLGWNRDGQKRWGGQKGKDGREGEGGRSLIPTESTKHYLAAATVWQISSYA